MGLSKGINAYIGFGGEGTYGTKGSIDLFHCIVSENLKHQKDLFVSECLSGDWHQDMFYSAGRNEGSVTFEHRYTGLELFWHSLLGTYTYSVDTPVAGANTHVFTHVPSTNSYPTGISIEAIRGIGGSVEVNYLGMKVIAATLEFAPRQPLRVTFDLVGQGTSRSAATSPTLAFSNLILPAHKTTLNLGGNAFTMLSGSMKISLPRDSEREHYGETFYKEPVVNGRPEAEFTFECEHNDAAGEDIDQFLVDYESENEITGPEIVHQGDIITGSTDYELDINATKAYIAAATPATQDPGITRVSVEGRITEGLSVTLINDTTQVT